MKNILFTILICLVLLGCSRWEVQRESFIDPSNRSMTVPSSSKVDMFHIKKKLREDGWKLKIADTTLEEEKQSEKKSVTEVKFETKYRLIFRQEMGQGTFLTVVDNEKNEMVIDISSKRNREDELGEKLVEELRKTN